MKTFPKENWQELVTDWDPEDDEDAGWRKCPICEGLSFEEPEDYTCLTCHGMGKVQWDLIDADNAPMVTALIRNSARRIC